MANIACGYDIAGNAKTYTTVQTAYAAASDGDTIQMYYADATQGKAWHLAAYINCEASGVLVSIEAMITGLLFSSISIGFMYTNGAGSTTTTNLLIKGFTICTPNGMWYLEDSSRHEFDGFTITFENCKFFEGIYSGHLEGTNNYYQYAGTSPLLIMINCVFVGKNHIHLKQASRLKAYYCTFYNMTTYAAYNSNVYNYKANGQCDVEFVNCLFHRGMTNTLADINMIGAHEPTGVTVDHCAANCSSSERGWDILVANQTVTNMLFDQTANNLKLATEFTDMTLLLQPMTGSSLLGAGRPISGITTDILGNTRDATNPSIGCYETAYSAGGGGGGGTQSFIEGTTTIQIS